MRKLALVLLLALFPFSAHATVNEVMSRNDHVGDGTTVAYSYSFKVLAKDDISVLINGVPQVVDTNYLVGGLGASGGGTVTFLMPPTLGVRVTFLRGQPISQLSVYTANEAFPATRLMTDLDKNIMVDQMQEESIGRSLKFGTNSTMRDVVVDDPIANRCLSWDPTASKVVNVNCGSSGGGGGSGNVTGGGSLGQAAYWTSATDLSGLSLATGQVLVGKFGQVPLALYPMGVNIKAFGAVSDGVADDGPAIQATFAAGNKTVFLPRNTRWATLLTIPANTRVIGEDMSVAITDFMAVGVNSTMENVTYMGKRTGIFANRTGGTRTADSVGNIAFSVYKGNLTGAADDAYGVAVSHLGLGQGDAFFAQTDPGNSATSFSTSLFRGDLYAAGAGAVIYNAFLFPSSPSNAAAIAISDVRTAATYSGGNGAVISYQTGTLQSGDIFSIRQNTSSYTGTMISLDGAFGSGVYSGVFLQAGNLGIPRYRLMSDGSVEIKHGGLLRFYPISDTVNFVSITAPALSAPWALVLPTGPGTTGQVLTTNGSGVTSWTTVSGGGSGVSSLEALTGALVFVDDTNVTIVGSGTNLTLGWTGTLSATRGGTGTNSSASTGLALVTAGTWTYTLSPTVTGITTTGQAAHVVGPYGASSGNTGEVRFLELAANGTEYVAIGAPNAITTSRKIVLPAAPGSAGTCLSTDGGSPVETLTYASCAGSGTGLTSLNGLTGSTQTFTNDANITITSGGTAHVLGFTGTLSAARGGFGVNTSGSTGVPSVLAGVWSVSGTLPKALGGTGTVGGTTGSVPFWGATTLLENNTNLFWDNTNFMLRIGTNNSGVPASNGLMLNVTGSPVSAGTVSRIEAYTGGNGTVARTVMQMVRNTGVAMGDGLGIRHDYIGRDTDLVDNVWARILVSRAGGLDNTGQYDIQTSIAGTLASRLLISSAGDVLASGAVYSNLLFGVLAVGSAKGVLSFSTDSNANFLQLQAPATATGNHRWILPSTLGTAGSVLTNDGAGVLSWGVGAGGSIGTAKNVRDFGAAGDGATNDSTAFANAITAAQASASCAIYVPPGIYFLNSGVTISGNSCVMFGDGNASVIETHSAISAITVDLTSSRFWISVRNLRFNATVAGATGILISGTSAISSYHRYENLTFGGFLYGIHATKTDAMDWSMYSNLVFSPNSSGSLETINGIKFDNGSGTGNVFSAVNFVGTGVALEFAGTSIIGDITIQGWQVSATTTGFKFASGASYRERVTITNCQFDGLTTLAIDMVNYVNVSFSGISYGGAVTSTLTGTKGDIMTTGLVTTSEFQVLGGTVQTPARFKLTAGTSGTPHTVSGGVATIWNRQAITSVTGCINRVDPNCGSTFSVFQHKMTASTMQGTAIYAALQNDSSAGTGAAGGDSATIYSDAINNSGAGAVGIFVFEKRNVASSNANGGIEVQMANNTATNCTLASGGSNCYGVTAYYNDFGLNATGGVAFSAKSIGAGTGRWNAGFACYSPGATGSCFLDYSTAFASYALAGSYTWGIDFTLASYSGGYMRMVPPGTTRVLCVDGTSGAVFVSSNNTSCP